MPSTGSYVYLESEPGDPIGGGLIRTYTPANASLYLGDADYSRVAVNVTADVDWWGDFAAPGALQTGEYANVLRFPSSDPQRARLRWDGTGATCELASGWFVVDAIARGADAAVAAIDLRFEQRCAGSAAVLHGQIHLSRVELAPPPGTPPPPNLWRPAPGSTPASGDYVYLESDAGDDVGGGLSYLYTPSSAWISVSTVGDTLFVKVSGTELWNGTFLLGTSAGWLQPGFYGDAIHAGFQITGQPALSWLGEQPWPFVTGPIGWFTIDDVTYDGGILSGVDLRFEQHYESAAPALHGVVHWTGPWQPPPDVPSGSFVYLESDPGEFIGGGGVYGYTPDVAHVSVDASGSELTVRLALGDEWWTGQLTTNTASGRIEPGRYLVQPAGDAGANAVVWSHGAGNAGLSCQTVRGWIIVDDVVYTGDALASVALRFEEGCQGATGSLHGAVRWAAADAMPAGLWRPAPDAVPSSGNYVYLESEVGDPIGAGRRFAYTELASQLGFHQVDALFLGNAVSVDVVADRLWRGDFQVSWFWNRFDPGFYGDLSSLDFGDFWSTKLYWRGDGRGCASATGWLAVDRAEYVVNALTALDLRFEQRCDGAAGALHGQLHWSATEPVPSAPLEPPPATAWQPPGGSIPPAGNFAFLESEPGDYIGRGNTYLYTPDAYRIAAAANGPVLSVDAAGWSGRFEAMPGLAQLAPGFYGGIGGFQSGPSRGALDWYGYGRGCNMTTGWFSLDDATYAAGILTGAHLRFEQHCEDSPVALRGAFRWRGDVWRPAPGATPASGSYVYLESEPGEYVGAGQTYTYPQASFPFVVSATGGTLSVSFPIAPYWSGLFLEPGDLADLEAGTYANLVDYVSALDDPERRGGLQWFGDGRATQGQTGWFIIDRVAYAKGALSGIDLRFEQRAGAGPALHGQIHWDAP